VTYEDQPAPADVEVIFVSSDHDSDGFEEYYAEMPWAAVPFDAAAKDTLGEKYKVEGIPRVVVLSGADGSVVNDDARGVIAAKKSLSGVF
jgi:nucleoredoxin